MKKASMKRTPTDWLPDTVLLAGEARTRALLETMLRRFGALETP